MFSKTYNFKGVVNIVNMPETNYVTRLIEYSSKLKAAEDDYSKQIPRVEVRKHYIAPGIEVENERPYMARRIYG